MNITQLDKKNLWTLIKNRKWFFLWLAFFPIQIFTLPLLGAALGIDPSIYLLTQISTSFKIIALPIIYALPLFILFRINEPYYSKKLNIGVLVSILTSLYIIYFLREKGYRVGCLIAYLNSTIVFAGAIVFANAFYLTQKFFDREK